MDLISGIVSLSGKDLLDFDAGYHVIDVFISHSKQSGKNCHNFKFAFKVRHIIILKDE